MGMTFRERVAAASLGLIPPDQLSEVATCGLVEGYGSRSLAALAGQSAYDAWEVDRLWSAALTNWVCASLIRWRRRSHWYGLTHGW